MKNPISAVAGVLLATGTLLYSHNANAQISHFSGPYIGFGYANYSASHLTQSVSVDTSDILEGTSASLSSRTDSSNEFHILRGVHALLGANASIPIKLEVEISHTQVKESISVEVFNESENSRVTASAKDETAITTIGANGIFHTKLDERFSVGIGAGIGLSHIDPRDFTATINEQDYDFGSIFGSENRVRINSILELTANITPETRVSLRHGFGKFIGSDYYGGTYNRFGISLQFAL